MGVQQRAGLFKVQFGPKLRRIRQCLVICPTGRLELINFIMSKVSVTDQARNGLGSAEKRMNYIKNAGRRERTEVVEVVVVQYLCIRELQILLGHCLCLKDIPKREVEEVNARVTNPGRCRRKCCFTVPFPEGFRNMGLRQRVIAADLSMPGQEGTVRSRKRAGRASVSLQSASTLATMSAAGISVLSASTSRLYPKPYVRRPAQVKQEGKAGQKVKEPFADLEQLLSLSAATLQVPTLPSHRWTHTATGSPVGTPHSLFLAQQNLVVVFFANRLQVYNISTSVRLFEFVFESENGDTKVCNLFYYVIISHLPPSLDLAGGTLDLPSFRPPYAFARDIWQIFSWNSLLLLPI